MMKLMICAGMVCMAYLFYQLLQSEHIGHKGLYVLLLSTLVYFCLKILHEWYHYAGITIPGTPENAPNFSVDVLTTYCAGEPYAMIRTTLEAAQQIKYPHTTYLCDEANDPALRELCATLGVRHVTRDNRINAKAGNINNALQQATGELCLILDPDHIPNPEFLDRIVPHFSNDKVGYVQTVQAYYNIHESLIAKGAAQQTFQFYGPMMMSMQRYGTVQAIGANCTFRRSALDSIGGHAPGLAEDMHTAMLLMAKGWKSVYVPEILTRGLVPSTLSAYYKQQLKWSRGVFELLLVTYPRIFKHLTWRQRIHYGTLPAFYLAGFFYLINFLLPVIALFSGQMPLRMDLGEFLLLGAPLFYATVLIRHYSQYWLMEERERGFHVVGGFLLIGTWWIHSIGFVMSLLRMNVPYDPTPKDGNEANNWPLNIPNGLILLLSISAAFYGMRTHHETHYMAMELMALLNGFFMAFIILASRQQRWRSAIESRRETLLADHYLRKARIRIWLTNHMLMRYFRVSAPVLLLLTAVMSFLLLTHRESFRFSLLDEADMIEVMSQYKQHEKAGGSMPMTVLRGLATESEFRILKPAVVLFEGETAPYHAMLEREGQWTIADTSQGWSLDWYLIRLDKEAIKFRVRPLGQGNRIKVDIPEPHSNYRIMLTVSKGSSSLYCMDHLNTPLPAH